MLELPRNLNSGKRSEPISTLALPTVPAHLVTPELLNAALYSFGVGSEVSSDRTRKSMPIEEVQRAFSKVFREHFKLTTGPLPTNVHVSTEAPACVGIDSSGSNWIIRPELLLVRSAILEGLLRYLANSAALACSFEEAAPLELRTLAAHLKLYGEALSQRFYNTEHFADVGGLFSDLRRAGWSIRHEELIYRRIEELVRHSPAFTDSVFGEQRKRAELKDLLFTGYLPGKSLERIARDARIQTWELLRKLQTPYDLHPLPERIRLLRTQVAEVSRVGVSIRGDSEQVGVWFHKAQENLSRHAFALTHLIEMFASMECRNKEKAALPNKYVEFVLTCAYDLPPEHWSSGKNDFKSIFLGPERVRGLEGTPFKSKGDEQEVLKSQRSGALRYGQKFERAGLERMMADYSQALAETREQLRIFALVAKPLCEAIEPSWRASRQKAGYPIELTLKKVEAAQEVPFEGEVASLTAPLGLSDAETREVMQLYPSLLRFSREELPGLAQSLRDVMRILGKEGLIAFGRDGRHRAHAQIPISLVTRASQDGRMNPACIIDALVTDELVPARAGAVQAVLKRAPDELLVLRVNQVAVFATLEQYARKLVEHRARLAHCDMAIGLALAAPPTLGIFRLSKELFQKCATPSPQREFEMVPWYKDDSLRHQVLTRPHSIPGLSDPLITIKGLDFDPEDGVSRLPPLSLYQHMVDGPSFFYFAESSRSQMEQWRSSLKELASLCESRIEALRALKRVVGKANRMQLHSGAVYNYLQERGGKQAEIPHTAGSEPTLSGVISCGKQLKLMFEWLQCGDVVDATLNAVSYWQRLDFFSRFMRAKEYEQVSRLFRMIDKLPPTRENLGEVTAQFSVALNSGIGDLKNVEDPIVSKIALPLLNKLLTTHGAFFADIVTRAQQVPFRDIPKLEEQVFGAIHEKLLAAASADVLAPCFDSALVFRTKSSKVHTLLSKRALDIVSAHSKELLLPREEEGEIQEVAQAACRFLFARGVPDDLSTISDAIAASFKSLNPEFVSNAFRFVASLANLLEDRGLEVEGDRLLRSVWDHCMTDERLDLSSLHSYLRNVLSEERGQRIARALLPTPVDIQKMLQRTGISEEVQKLLIKHLDQESLRAALELLPDRDPAALAISAKTFREGALSEAALSLGSRAQRYMLARLAFYDSRRVGEKHLTLKRPGNAAITAPNHYMILGVPRGASGEMISTSLNIIQVVFHPDWFRDQPEKKREAEDLIQTATTSHDMLMNPRTRQEYEMKISAGLGIVRGGEPFFPNAAWFTRLIADGLFNMQEAAKPVFSKSPERKLIG